MPCRWARIGRGRSWPLTRPRPRDPSTGVAPLPPRGAPVPRVRVQEERDREAGERKIATKTIEILEIEKRGLQDHLRSLPGGKKDAARLQGGKRGAARATNANSAVCVIS